MKRLILPVLGIFFLSLFLTACKKDTIQSPDAGTSTSSIIEKTSSTTTSTNTATLVSSTQQSLLAALPARVGFGAQNDISQTAQFIQEADYRYCYLAGDIFSNGWSTWNAPTGEYARTFLNQTGQMGKVPVFTYYNIVPAKNRYEDPGFTNLNDAEVMNKYFDDFKLLLQICKAYGKPVIIHYEPDLMGYMEMYKNDATKTTIKVAASNQADVLSFSNDARGLFQAIVSMRNKYAPNVLLAWHASQWATGVDLIKGKANPEQLASQTAAYYQSLNAPFDLIFSEFSDRDEGYNQFVNNNANTVWSTQATAANGNLSDFDRFQRFLKQLNISTGQKIILWQIPVGNTQTKTCNNTGGHYTDNRPEYFLQPVLQSGSTSKISQYGQAGVIGFLFGSGATNCTSYMDLKGDGVTAAGETADDDGGYLRKAIKAYYQQGPVAVQ